MDEKIVEWLAIKYLPFNFFDDQPTQTFFESLNPAVVMPKRTSMREKVLLTFEKCKQNVMNILVENSSKISFTIDGWTSINNNSYYGITAHFIDQLWQMHSLVIDFIPSKGQHSGKHIASLFYDCMKQYNILTKIQGITVDNVSANTTFLLELGNLLTENKENFEFNASEQHFRCFAHILNLGVQDILQSMKVPFEEDKGDYEEISDEDPDFIDNASSPVLRLRILMKKIKISEQLSNNLRHLCEVFNVKYSAVSIDVATRWNSTSNMISLALKMKNAINPLCDHNECLKNFKIRDDEWNTLTLVNSFLRYFKDLSTILCGDHYPTLPSVIVGFNILIDNIEKLMFELDSKQNRTESDELIICAFKAGRDKMLKHYKKTNWIYCAALILDPRHKVATFSRTSWGREMKESSVENFERIFKGNYLAHKNAQPPEIVVSEENLEEPSENGDFQDLNSFYGSIDKEQSQREGERTEIDRYLDLSRSPQQTNLLHWWKEHEIEYPRLAKMARDLLAIPATSVPAERLFSKAGLTIRKHRNRLNAESARSLLCLNSWFTCSMAHKLK